MTTAGDARRARLGPHAVAAAREAVAAKPAMTPRQRAELMLLRRREHRPDHLPRTA